MHIHQTITHIYSRYYPEHQSRKYVILSLGKKISECLAIISIDYIFYIRYTYSKWHKININTIFRYFDFLVIEFKRL